MALRIRIWGEREKDKKAAAEEERDREELRGLYRLAAWIVFPIVGLLLCLFVGIVWFLVEFA